MKRSIKVIFACAAMLLSAGAAFAAGTDQPEPTVKEIMTKSEAAIEHIDSLTCNFSMTIFSTKQRFSSEGDMQHLVPFLFKSSSKTTFGQMKFNQTTVYDGSFVWQMTETPLGKQVLKAGMNNQGMISRMQQPFKFNDILDPYRVPRLLSLLSNVYTLEYTGRDKLDDTEVYLLNGRLKDIPAERQSVSGLPLPLLTSTRLYVRAQDAMLVKLQGFDANDVLILEYELKKLTTNPPGIKAASFAFKPPADAKVVEVPKQ